MSRRSELAEVVDDFLTAKCGQAVVSAAEAAGDAPELWQQVAELGWTLATLPESAGGAEISFAEACGIVRVAASHAAPLPLGDTSLIAAWMLHAAGLAVPSGQLAVAPATPGERVQARRAGDGWTLHGRLEAVPWAPTAAAVVVLAESEAGERLVAALDPDGSVRPRTTNLAGEPRADVLLDGAAPAAERIAPAPAFLDAGAVLARGALVRAVMLLGALERIRDLTISYARTADSSAARSADSRPSAISSRTSRATSRSRAPRSSRRSTRRARTPRRRPPRSRSRRSPSAERRLRCRGAPIRSTARSA